MNTTFEESRAIEFLTRAVLLISERAKESALRHNLSTYLSQMFPEMPWWVKDHAERAESSASFHKGGQDAGGFVDTLVGATAIEYERNIEDPGTFNSGYGQVKDYCADLLNRGVPPDLVIGVLSDTVRWRAYRVYSVQPPGDSKLIGRDHLQLEEIDACDLAGAGHAEAKMLGAFLERHLGRLGARQLSASTLSRDLGFHSDFGKPHLERTSSLVEQAFGANPDYARLITKLWNDFVSYLGGSPPGSEFDNQTYADELYILTLAKLICANVLSEQALVSSDVELRSILGGTFFQNQGLSNLVEYDYFGWLNAEPHVDALLSVASAIQLDLAAYDFRAPPTEDLFGALMAQLAKRSQRLLLGQEWTPSWLAGKVVREALKNVPAGQDTRLVDMCCGSGAMVVEAVKQVKAHLVEAGTSPATPGARQRLTEAITGFDIDPLAVMLAKMSWVLAARDWLDPAVPVTIPIYHADSLFAVTPLSTLNAELESTHHRLLLDDKHVTLPAFLISPEKRALFDVLLDRSYVVAMASARSPASDVSKEMVARLVREASEACRTPLELQEHELICIFTAELINALEELQRAGRNGIWAFVLRNSYRPGLVAGRFNGLVSNPPWLALSKIVANPYTGALRERAGSYGITPPGPAHLHIELATVFLLAAVDQYLVDDAAIACVLPESVMSAHHHHPFRSAAYATAPKPVRLRVDGLWRVETGTFKNEAIVLFGTKCSPTSDVIPGADVGRESMIPVTFRRITRGSRSAWSDNPTLGDMGTGFFKPADFRQGADIMPRALVFHSLTRNATGSWNASPISVRSPERYLRVLAKTHRSFSITASGVHDDLIFDVLLSHHLTPFDIDNGAKGILPIKRGSSGVWEAMTLTDVSVTGAATANVLNEILAALGPEATPQDYFGRLDTNRRKLRRQAWSSGWLVFMGAGGSNVCAAYAPVTRFPQNKVIIDQTLYWAVVDTEDEAVYLTGLLNSPAVTSVIREFQPRGQFGERHIHTLPLGATPPFECDNPAHMDVVSCTRKLVAEWSLFKNENPNITLELLNPNYSTLARRRTRVCRALSNLSAWEAYENACKAVYCLA